MTKTRLALFFIAAVFATVAAVSVDKLESSNSEPFLSQIEYRPGAFFPEGFPLHGKVSLLTSPVVEAGKREQIKIEYTVGDMPVEPGMSLEIWKHFTSDVEQLQSDNSAEPAYFSVQLSNPTVQVRTHVHTNWARHSGVSVFPYRKVVAVEVEAGILEEGDKVLFELGGEHGVRMQHYQENLFNFRVVIVHGRKVLGYGGDALFRVTGGPLAKLRVQSPSIVTLAEPFTVAVVPQDQWGSPAKNEMGLKLRIVSGAVSAGPFHFEPRLKHYIARDVMSMSEGTVRIGVATKDGTFKGLSNPVWVKKYPNRHIYFGELHQHTYLHDGRGVFEELYLYGRRFGLLDFGAITPHHAFITGGSGPLYYLKDVKWPVDHWPKMEQANRKLNGWQDLVTILGYEYSVGTKDGGHHNVYYNADSAPTTMHLEPAKVNAPIARMFRNLQLVNKPTLVIPHIGGSPPDWSHPTDLTMERLFEIASVHGVFEESYFRHLENGLRLGAIGAGDTHTSAMGNAYPGLIYTMTNALAGVYATGKTRDEIWDGLYKKRTFAVTGNTRAIVDFRVNRVPMGGELASGLAQNGRIEAEISGTAPLLRVQILKNLKVIYTAEPALKKGNLVRVIWGDNIYQRRAVEGITKGDLSATGGSLQLIEVLNRDQAFEEIKQEGEGISWATAAVSGDRDGFLVDISKAEGDSLRFRLDDTPKMGLVDVRIPLSELRSKGSFIFRKTSQTVRQSYMKLMQLEPTFTLELNLVDSQGPMDYRVIYLDPEEPKGGDSYLLRVEQLDSNKIWSSPVWVN